MTGKDQWKFLDGASTIPSCTVYGNIILVPSNGLAALQGRPDGNSHTQLWQDNKLGPGTASPTLSGNLFYVVNKANVLTCAKVQTGEIVWRMRLKGPISSSPITTSTHLFIFNEEGLGQIILLGEKEGQLANSIALNETILCTPAIAEESLFVRSDNSLWRLSE